ncbi:MAG: peptidyl-prolyl cis-trans isomerase [Dehalococcoidia bacterium]
MDNRISCGTLGGILREPVVHFVALAALLFVINAAVDGQRSANIIEIDQAHLNARVLALEATLGTELSDEDRLRLREAYIDEQVLVREALSLGLEDDAQIHDFLAQKMLHVLSADVIQPTDAELKAYFDVNRARYTSPATVTVTEFVVNSHEQLPSSLLQQLRAGVPPNRLSTDLPHRSGVLADTSIDDLVLLFGERTAELVFQATVDSWVGPHDTRRGQHWFRVTDRTERDAPPLEAMREQVRLDWVVEQEDVRLEGRVAELRQRYQIVFTDEAIAP